MMRMKPAVESGEFFSVGPKGNAILRTLLVPCLLAGLHIAVCSVAHADGPDPITLDVKSGTLNDPVGAGFEHITSVSILKLTLKIDGAPVTVSEIIPADTIPNLWSRDGGQDKWKTAGIKPNDKFYAVFKARGGGGGGAGPGGGTTSWDYGSVSDVDIDADTDNDSQANPRVPDSEDSEDEAEYATGDTGANGPRGLVMWVEDGAGGWESPWCRMDLAVDAKTTGQLKLNWDNKLEMKINGGATITPEYTVPPNPLAKNGTPTHPQFLVRPKATTTQPANVEITATFRDSTKYKAAHKEAVDKIKVSIVNQCCLTLAVNNTAQTEDDYAPVEDTGRRTPVTVTLLPATEPPGENTAPYTITISEVDLNGNPVTPAKLKFWEGSDPSEDDPLGTLEMDWDESKQQHSFYVSGLETGLKYIRAKVTSADETNPPSEAVLEIRIFKLGIYIDDSYETPLEDYPESGSLARSPKYMFTGETVGEGGGPYMKMEVPGKDPESGESVTFKITSSEGESITVSLSETGVASNIFTSGLLYPAFRIYYKTLPIVKCIKVYHEPVLEFAFLPDGINKLGQIDYMVDRAEIGMWWQSKYKDYSDFATLVQAHPSMWHLWAGGTLEQGDGGNMVSGLADYFTKNFDNGDLNCKRSHFDHAINDDYVDAVDLATFTGHGTTDNGTDFYIALFVDKVNGVKQPVQKVWPREIGALGNVDAEWVVFNTCRFMRNSDVELKKMFSGLRLALGYYDRMLVDPRAGTYFAYYLQNQKKTIWEAWKDQAKRFQNSGKKVTGYGEQSAFSDKLYGTQPIVLGRDPGESSTYERQTYQLP